MSLFNVFDIAGSGMNAQSIRLNITSSNIANADSIAGSAKEAYKARQPIFSALMDKFSSNKGSDVSVQMRGVTESQSEHAMRYQPDHPYANDEGYIFESNVNLVEEMTNMISSSRSYQNNIEVLNTSKSMLMQTLKLGE
ncbi:MAG TPA: flagellar basal body rod protein FlgC [Gammaproteobacteria bacterium]|jgi:flagellar basal-body rod protein FlgC|nr:flagellar basal body rod protein FlgC [Gammaproteobacteria bacterium]